jgi:maleylacetoacetate isomerase
MEQVPALQIDGATLVESLSILSYLEETRPQRPLLPPDVVKRAKVLASPRVASIFFILIFW